MMPGNETKEQIEAINWSNLYLRMWADDHHLPRTYGDHDMVPAIAVGGRNLVTILEKLKDEIVSLRQDLERVREDLDDERRGES